MADTFRVVVRVKRGSRKQQYWWWVLQDAANGEKLATSEMYVTEQKCMQTARSVASAIGAELVEVPEED